MQQAQLKVIGTAVALMAAALALAPQAAAQEEAKASARASARTAEQAAVALGPWTSDPVVTGENCDNLEYEEIVGFVDRYLGDSISYGNADKESGAQMMSNYAIASTLVLRSQVCLAEALELKRLADDLRKQRDVLTSGTSMSKREMKKQRKITAKANAEIEATAADIDELTPEQRKRFGQGTAAYLLGTYATGQVFKSVDEYMIESANATRQEAQQAAAATKSRFGGLPGVDKVAGAAKAGAGIFKRATETTVVFKGLKDHTVDLYETSKFLREYSSSNGVELPADATNQLAQVSDWV